MINKKLYLDYIQFFFNIVFIIFMIVALLSIIHPFVLSFTWAGIFVISTWSFMLKLQSLCNNKRVISIFIIIFVVILIFVIPTALLINSLIDNSLNLIRLIFEKKMHLPQFPWLIDIPIIGNKLDWAYNKFLSNDNVFYTFIYKINPYIKETTEFFFAQLMYFGRFMIHLGLMLIFSIFFYFNGEKIVYIFRFFSYRIAGKRGKEILLLISRSIRSVVLSIIITSIIQSILSGIGLLMTEITYAPILITVMIFLCLIQVGPLPILIPVIIWLYWNDNTSSGSFLLIWSFLIAIIDNILKTILIKTGSNLPIMFILCGAIGGILAFGVIGIFIGPVILAVTYRLFMLWLKNIIYINKRLYLKNTNIQIF